MLILRTTDELKQWRSSVPYGASVGFVPTMGALHAGHMKLVEECRAASDVCVASIFVNPLQFGPNEDLARYPRPFERDADLCRHAGVDALFAPDPAGFYGPDHATFVEVEGLDLHLCGATRPGHFRGVCTVVLKLFNLVRPHRAWFGKKDIQQALILRRMADDLATGVELVLCDTVREPSGLALSSRNAYLSEDERERAASLYRALRAAADAFARGERSAATLVTIMRGILASAAPTRIDYVEVVSQAKLEPMERVERPAVLALAVRFGNTRLIDNLLLPPEAG